MRAAIYVRVSSDKQVKEGDSISAQLDALRKYIRKYSYECVGEFVDDGISGLLRCVECGSMMASQSRVQGKRNRAFLYRCPKHFQRYAVKCGNSKVVTEAVLERKLLDMLPNIIIEQIEVHEKRQIPVVSYERQKAALEKKIERLKVLFVNDEISLEEYRVDKATLMLQIEQLTPVAPSEPPQAVLQLQGLNISEIYETLTKSERRAFWRGIIKEIRFDKDRIFFIDWR